MASAIDFLPTISSCQAVSQMNLATARWRPHAGYGQPAARSPAASQRRQHRRKRRQIDSRLDPDARPAHLDLDLTAELAWWRGHLPSHRLRRRNAARLAGRRGAALRSNQDRHKAGRVEACRCRQLLSPHREQPTDNAIAARDLGNVGALLEALRYDPGLLLRRPPSPPTLTCNHLDTTIRTAVLPGIKHGICHRLPPNDQLMPGCIADEPRDCEVEASCRLRLIRRGSGHGTSGWWFG